jgi:hypothetical protein
LVLFPRKRPRADISFLEHLDAAMGQQIRKIHLVGDDVSTQASKAVGNWFAETPARYLPSHACPLFKDAPGGTAVQHLSTQTPAYG